MLLSRIHSGPILDFYIPDFSTQLELPLAGTAVSAGFPSPAEEYIEIALDLNKELIKHPAATFYARVKGSSMIDAGIADGDLLIIDKALEEIERGRGSLYDTTVADTCLRLFREKGYSIPE